MTVPYTSPFPHEGLAHHYPPPYGPRGPMPAPPMQRGSVDYRHLEQQQPQPAMVPFYGFAPAPPFFGPTPFVAAYPPIPAMYPQSAFSTPYHAQMVAVPPPPPYDAFPQFTLAGNGHPSGEQQHSRLAHGSHRRADQTAVHSHNNVVEDANRPSLIAPTSTVDYDLIPPMPAVPPPAPIERSAVPLSDFAVEMVWEACSLAIDHEGEKSRSSTSFIDEVKQRSLHSPKIEQFRSQSLSPATRSRSGSSTPDLFGVIGDGRRARDASCDSIMSNGSSPSSSMPGTPASSLRHERSPGRLDGVGFHFGSFDHARSPTRSGGPSSPFIGASRPPFSRPASAFRSFVRHVLTATLVAPEDLVLALYLIARIPSNRLVQKPKSDSPSDMQEAIKSAPFKVFLGALMLANKTLQDNSYRNETFAAVSGVPLKDVTQLEVNVFAALDFDLSIRETGWKAWVGIVRQRHFFVTKAGGIGGGRHQAGDHGIASEVEGALARLWANLFTSTATTRNNSPVLKPMTYNSSKTNMSVTDSLAAVDLDACGPLEEYQRVVPDAIPLNEKRPIWHQSTATPVASF